MYRIYACSSATLRESCEQWSAVGLASSGMAEAFCSTQKELADIAPFTSLLGMTHALLRLTNKDNGMRPRFYELIRLGIYGYSFYKELKYNEDNKGSATSIAAKPIEAPSKQQKLKEQTLTLSRRMAGILTACEGLGSLFVSMNIFKHTYSILREDEYHWERFTTSLNTVSDAAVSSCLLTASLSALACKDVLKNKKVLLAGVGVAGVTSIAELLISKRAKLSQIQKLNDEADIWQREKAKEKESLREFHRVAREYENIRYRIQNLEQLLHLPDHARLPMVYYGNHPVAKDIAEQMRQMNAALQAMQQRRQELERRFEAQENRRRREDERLRAQQEAERLAEERRQEQLRQERLRREQEARLADEQRRQAFLAQPINEDDSCPICLETFREAPYERLAACGHALHTGCLRDIRANAPRDQSTGLARQILCPSCRVPIR